MTDASETATSDHATSRARVRRDLVWGRTALGSILLSVALVVWALVEITDEKVTNRTLLGSVALAGAAGGAVSSTVQLAEYLGSRTFRSTWTAYFLIRPLVGGGLAVVVYVAMRGVLLGRDVGAAELNLYGILAVSVVIGMYAMQLGERLLGSFDSFFAGAAGRFEAAKRDREGPGTVILDRYEGFVAYQLSHAGGSEAARLTIHMQGERPREEPGVRSMPIDVGEGVPAAVTRFRFTVFRHNFASVDPQSFEIDVKYGEPLSAGRTLIFEPLPPEDRSDGPAALDALIEVSQKGQTVGALSIRGEEHR